MFVPAVNSWTVDDFYTRERVGGWVELDLMAYFSSCVAERSTRFLFR